MYIFCFLFLFMVKDTHTRTHRSRARTKKKEQNGSENEANGRAARKDSSVVGCSLAAKKVHADVYVYSEFFFFPSYIYMYIIYFFFFRLIRFVKNNDSFNVMFKQYVNE